MKKVLLLLTLLALALALVACGGEKDPSVTEPPVTQDPAVTDKPAVTTAPTSVTYTVKFMDAEIFKDENSEQIVISEQPVRRGKGAKTPRAPYHEGYVFLGWDVDDYSDVTSDMVITAQYRPLDTYTLEFYDDAGNILDTVEELKEGEAATVPVAPLKVGYVFAGWDKPVGSVDRTWADFEAYKDLSDEERAATKMVFKTTAVYEEADGTIPFVENVTFELKETTDKDGKTVYVPADFDKFSEGFKYVELVPGKGGAGADVTPENKFNQVNATTYYAWDGEYIYGYVVIEDPTLLSRGPDYVNGQKDPWENDMLEYWFTFGTAPTETFHQRFTIDFFGIKCGAYDGKSETGELVGHNSMSNYFDRMDHDVKVVKETNNSYIFFKLVAKDEEGNALQAGSVHYVALQIDDIREIKDINDIGQKVITNRYNSSSNKLDYENGWEKYTLGAK